MASRKSQVTIFIIAGLVMFMIAGLLLYLGSSVQTRKEALYSDSSPVTRYVSECVKRAAEQGMDKASTQSGYIFASQNGPTSDYYSTSYEGKLYVTRGMLKIPFAVGERGYSLQSRQDIERQTEQYINRAIMNNCIDFGSFQRQYIVIAASGPETNVTITDKEIFTHMKMPVEITELSTGSNYKISDFSASKATPIGEVHHAAEIIAGEISIRQKLGSFDAENPNIPGNINGVSAAHEEVRQGSRVTGIILTLEKSGASFTFAIENTRQAS